MMKNNSIVYQRHQPLNALYLKDPQKAMIIDVAEVIGTNLDDPFRTSVNINDELQVSFPIGVHRAIGGDHDFPNPGDILSAALAACFESTLRMIANRLQIELKETRVKASAIVDVRGTLMLDPSVPVGFQQMKLDIELKGRTVKENMLPTLVNAAKHCCVIYQTIKKGIPIEVNINIGS